MREEVLPPRAAPFTWPPRGKGGPPAVPCWPFAPAKANALPVPLAWVQKGGYAEMDTPAQEPRPLQARLGLWDAASILVGIIIGVGIFTAPATVFSYTSGPWAALAIWGLGGLISLVGAFCF